MGNNSAFSNFGEVIIAIHNRGVLDLPLLQDISKAFSDQDADSGGYSGTLANDGKDMLEIVAALSGETLPPKPENLPEDWKDWTPEQYQANDAYNDAIWDIFFKTAKLES